LSPFEDRERNAVNDHEWTVEVTPGARAAISREIKAQWDGRELGGPLVGQTYGDRIVVTDANGIGVGVETPRGETWIEPGRGRWLDFALACDADLVGDWHCHPGGSTTVPSAQDVRSWQATREVLGSPVYLGLIFLPRKVLVQGIHYDDVVWSFREPEVGEYVITDAGCQRTRFVLSGEDRHEPSVY
jgi:Prokaryotic homologs of the JAB domain